MSQESAKIIEANHVKYVAFEKIYFDFNKSTIKEESKLSLNKLVKILNEDKALNININAHTDNKGPDAYNLVLSEKRAQSTKQYLIEKGIDTKRLIAKGFGESQSLSDCKANCTTEQLEMDRRVDFIIQN
jgi:outer membrane protein OmpA-like peptidoglycan-associated protein